MAERQFIRNCVSIDVNGLESVNHYTVKTMYNVVDDDGFADIEFVLIDEFDYTWAEIEEDGGIAKINADFRELYGEDCFW